MVPFFCAEKTGLVRVSYEFQFGRADFEMFVRHPIEISGKQLDLRGSVCWGEMKAVNESCQHTDDKATGKTVGRE